MNDGCLACGMQSRDRSCHAVIAWLGQAGPVPLSHEHLCGLLAVLAAQYWMRGMCCYHVSLKTRK